MASAIDCETVTEDGVELVRKHPEGPDIREPKGTVLRRMSIVDAAATSAPTTKRDDGGGESENKGGHEEDTEEEENVVVARPSFCMSQVRVRRGRQQADIITYIPTLCDLLVSHIDALIESNNSEEYSEMDEDDAVAFEELQTLVCLQLIHMTESSGLREEGSWRHLVSVMPRVIARLATPDDLVETCVRRRPRQGIPVPPDRVRDPRGHRGR